MQCSRLHPGFAILVVLTIGVSAAPPARVAGFQPAPEGFEGGDAFGTRAKPAPAQAGDARDTTADVAKHWTADNGNGTYSNPLFYEEFEDPDVTRVGEDYYLAGTTMHMNPAVQLMHSRDLVNWELAGYCMDRLDPGPAFRLEDGRGIYGRGIRVPCIGYHNGMFHVFSNDDCVGAFTGSSTMWPADRTGFTFGRAGP